MKNNFSEKMGSEKFPFQKRFRETMQIQWS